MSLAWFEVPHERWERGEWPGSLRRTNVRGARAQWKHRVASIGSRVIVAMTSLIGTIMHTESAQRADF